MNERAIILTTSGVYFMASSASAGLGRALGIVWMYDWGDGIGMAYSTAANFFLLGLVLTLLGKTEHAKNNP